ncbi:MAG: hypothetical protein J6Q84_01685 [Kiritimatiellae bacterium]|nr:hypothetical protein [Kiritimatiellia bacterium]
MENEDKSYISAIRTPDGKVHHIKDQELDAALKETKSQIGANANAIQEILETIKNGTRFIGVTTSDLYDGSQLRKVQVDGEDVIANVGDFVVAKKSVLDAATSIEFIWTGSKWSELGSTGTLRALAFKDSASVSYTPKGKISKPNVTNSPSTATVSHVTFSVDSESETLKITTSSVKAMTKIQIWAGEPIFTGEKSTITVS